MILLYTKMLRIKQWLKNLLIFIPFVIEYQTISIELIKEGTLIFVAFSLTASFIYIINDWLDRKDDALHPEKKYRPFASKELNGYHAIISLVILLFLIIIFF